MNILQVCQALCVGFAGSGLSAVVSVPVYFLAGHLGRTMPDILRPPSKTLCAGYDLSVERERCFNRSGQGPSQRNPGSCLDIVLLRWFEGSDETRRHLGKTTSFQVGKEIIPLAVGVSRGVTET